ncbi:MAG: MOSC domain-containing protein [Opitutaceae bacterium]
MASSQFRAGEVPRSMHVSALFVYPVKSLRGLNVSNVALDPLGFVGDRRFMVVDETGRFLSQRTVPRLALIATELTGESLLLNAHGKHELYVPRNSDGTTLVRLVSVWSSEQLQAEDCGDAAAAWLGDFLGLRCRLVRAGAQFHRPLAKPGKARVDDVLGFNDGYPVLVISEAALATLNDRLAGRGEEVVPMNRFRPNLVIADCAAFAEDSWNRIRIGGAVLRAGGPCARCVVTTTDQETAARGPEPLRTLATFRRDRADPTNVNFGQNFIHETKAGTIERGAPVEIID